MQIDLSIIRFLPLTPRVLEPEALSLRPCLIDIMLISQVDRVEATRRKKFDEK